MQAIDTMKLYSVRKKRLELNLINKKNTGENFMECKSLPLFYYVLVLKLLQC